MSDKKNFEEEYQYIEEPDVEPIDVNPDDEPVVKESKKSSQEYTEKFASLIQEPTIKRNALMAVLGLFILLGLLRCVNKPSIPQEMDKPKPVTQTTYAQQNQMANQSPGLSDNQLQDLINMQKNMQSNLASMNDKLNQLNSQLSILNSNNQALQQELSQLMGKYQGLQQSIHEAIASAKSRPQIRTHRATGSRSYSPPAPKINYFVEAIIPGRAWLVSSQGRTITVRVGSILPGYGRVIHIDAQQGRVEMSTSKVFVFSQAD
jgi:intracellular multiplication protein IcmG